MKTLHRMSRISGYCGLFSGRGGKRCVLWLLGVLLVLGLGSQAHALLYDPGTLNFSAEDQSMWGTGEATVSSSENNFYGVAWGTFAEELPRELTIGEIIGDVTEVLGVTVDTRSGAEVNVTSSGRVGIEAGYTVSSGTVDATADFNVMLQLPDDPV